MLLVVVLNRRHRLTKAPIVILPHLVSPEVILKAKAKVTARAKMQFVCSLKQM